MELSLQDHATLARALGKEPWEIEVAAAPDGGVFVKPAKPTADRGAAYVGANTALANAPGSAVGTVAGVALNRLAQPAIEGAANIAGMLPGIWGKAARPLIRFGGNALAFGAGATAGKTTAEAFGPVKTVKNKILGSVPQQFRDQIQHPTASAVGEFAANFAGQKLPNPRELIRGVSKLGSKELTAAELNTLQNVGGGAVLGAGQEGVRQYKEGEFDPAALAVNAVAGAALGDPRGPLKVAGTALGSIGSKPKFNGAPTPVTTADDSIPGKLTPAEQADVQAELEALQPDEPGPVDKAKKVLDELEQVTPFNVIKGTLEDGMPKVAPPVDTATVGQHLAGQTTADPYTFQGQDAVPPEVAAVKKKLAEQQVGPPSERISVEVPKPDLAVIDKPIGEREFTNGAGNPEWKKESHALVYAGSNLDTGEPLYWIVRKTSSLKPANVTKVRTVGDEAQPAEPLQKALESGDLQPTGTTTQEAPGDLQAGADAVVAGKKPAALLSNVGDTVRLGDLEIEHTAAGTVVKRAGQKVETGADLGMTGEPKDLTEDAQFVSNKDAAGNEITGEVTSPENVEAALEAGRKVGAVQQEVLTPEEGLAQREQRRVEQTKGAPLYEPGKLEYVPRSVLGRVSAVDSRVGEAGYNAATERAAGVGRIFNKHVAEMQAIADKPTIGETMRKMSEAFDSKVAPVFTPIEQAIAGKIELMLQGSRDMARKIGVKIRPRKYYIPQMVDPQLAKDAEQMFEPFMKKWLPEYLHYNSTQYKPAQVGGFDPADATKYFVDYFQGASRAPNTEFGSDFGVLTKSARRYGLPPSMREKDPIRLWDRFGDRFMRQVAEEMHLKSDPEVARKLGYNEGGAPVGTVYTNMRSGLAEQLPNQARVPDYSGRREIIDATRQLVHSTIMQTPTAIINTVQKLKDYGVALSLNPRESIPVLRAAFDRFTNEYAIQLGKAIEMNLVRPGRDYTAENDNLDVAGNTARRMRNAGQRMFRLTLGDFFEAFNRTMDYSLGEALAEVNMKLRDSGDPIATKFWNRYGAGTSTALPPEENIARAARNFVTSIQTSYSVEGLPAWMLNNSTPGMLMRIQRFGWENMMRTYKTVLEPTTRGEYGPLFVYLLGSAATAPIVMKLRELFSGRPSGLPTDAEMKAAGADRAVEHTLNIMQMADAGGAFGLAGSAISTLAGDIRGGKRALVADPTINFSVQAMHNLLAAGQAIKDDEPALESIGEAMKRTFINTAQNLRPLTVGDDAKDVRDKQVFEYLTGVNQPTLPQIGDMLATGGLFSPGKGIHPTMEAAKAGDREAYSRLTTEEKREADNYPGGYEDPKKEAKRRAFTRASEGEESLQEYLKRRHDFKGLVHKGAAK